MLPNQSFPLFYNFLPWQSHTQISTTDGPPNGDTLPCLRSSLLDRPRQQKKWVQMGFVLTRLQKLRQIMESTIHVSNKFSLLSQHPSIKDFIYGSKYVLIGCSQCGDEAVALQQIPGAVVQRRPEGL